MPLPTPAADSNDFFQPSLNGLSLQGPGEVLNLLIGEKDEKDTFGYRYSHPVNGAVRMLSGAEPQSGHSRTASGTA
jgi:hypothetical protein